MLCTWHHRSLNHGEPTHDTTSRAETVVHRRPDGQGRVVHSAVDARAIRVSEPLRQGHLHPFRDVGDRRRAHCWRLCRAGCGGRRHRDGQGPGIPAHTRELRSRILFQSERKSRTLPLEPAHPAGEKMSTERSIYRRHGGSNRTRFASPTLASPISSQRCGKTRKVSRCTSTNCSSIAEAAEEALRPKSPMTCVPCGFTTQPCNAAASKRT